MKKINENIKLIIVLIMAIVISSMISIKAATTLSSTSVYYDTSKSGGSSSNVNGAIDELYSLTTDRDKLKQEILDLTWPVGSVYISTTDSSVESVQERFGGTWVKYANGTTLVSDDGKNYITNDETKGSGGSTSVKLSESNLPSHSHVIPALSGSSSTQNLTGTFTTLAWSGTGLGTGIISLVSSGYNLDHPGATGQNVFGQVKYNIYATHSHTITTTASNTTTCTNCSGAQFSIQDPYTVVYMYKRTA